MKLGFLGMNGAQSWNRTSDTAIFSRMLYRLSYLAVLRRLGPVPLRATDPVRSAFGPWRSRRDLNPRPSA